MTGLFPITETAQMILVSTLQVIAINRELERMGVTPGHLTHSERLQVITSLESAGIFLLKGAIKSAAAALGCSTASIYRYLSQINPSD